MLVERIGVAWIECPSGTVPTRVLRMVSLWGKWSDHCACGTGVCRISLPAFPRSELALRFRHVRSLCNFYTFDGSTACGWSSQIVRRRRSRRRGAIVHQCALRPLFIVFVAVHYD